MRRNRDVDMARGVSLVTYKRIQSGLAPDWPEWAIDIVAAMHPEWVRRTDAPFSDSDEIRRDMEVGLWNMLRRAEARGMEAEETWWDRYDNGGDAIANEAFYAITLAS